MSRGLENENEFSKSGSSHSLVFTVISRFVRVPTSIFSR
ncbi:hypothetical protein LEP1GSC198_0417 [Leptospira kirschneri str. JB]|nr:hypothetical protein LEP1GSC198_0417 [Leptospira kirschneri str. JB]